jgi:hypothetical protein
VAHPAAFAGWVSEANKKPGLTVRICQATCHFEPSTIKLAGKHEARIPKSETNSKIQFANSKPPPAMSRPFEISAIVISNLF